MNRVAYQKEISTDWDLLSRIEIIMSNHELEDTKDIKNISISLIFWMMKVLMQGTESKLFKKTSFATEDPTIQILTTESMLVFT